MPTPTPPVVNLAEGRLDIILRPGTTSALKFEWPFTVPGPVVVMINVDDDGVGEAMPVVVNDDEIDVSFTGSVTQAIADTKKSTMAWVMKINGDIVLSGRLTMTRQGNVQPTTGPVYVNLAQGVVEVTVLAGSGGGGGDGQSTIIDVPTPASTWIMDHNLGYYPVVQLMDEDEVGFHADLAYPTVNRVTATHAIPRAGKGIFR